MSPRARISRFAAAASVCALIALGGCDRAHMSSGFGAASRGAFAAQVIDPRAGRAAKPDQPLDPEEAAIIAHTYRRSLAPPSSTGDNAGRSPFLVLPPAQASAGAPYAEPPASR